MKTIIIAEAGVNHNGSVALAKQLIDKAKSAGVDYVKFQTFKTEQIISKSAKKASYQVANSANKEESQYDMVKRLELSFDDFVDLKNYCDQAGIGFLSTGFDIPSVTFLNTLNLDYFKIPSGDITNYPLLKTIAKTGKPIICSTGMATLGEVEATLELLLKEGASRDRITILHCNTEYPTPMEDVNLKAMRTMAQAFGVKTGYSDHTVGIEVPIAAVALGATMIEKHFTLDKNMDGPDHKASLNPNELSAMVTAIRNIEKAMGNGIKTLSPSESKNLNVARKSIHLRVSLPKGHTLTESDIVIKRPGDGITAVFMKQVIGKKLKSDLNEDHKLSWEEII
jgi:N,N'-diacetyllegionaminate synthase